MTYQGKTQWPMETIKELLETAAVSGEAYAELSSPREAELFRMAIKNYKRRYRTGQDLMVNVLTRTDDDGSVRYIVKILPKGRVKILEKEPA